MLSPKRVKHRKQHRGRRGGLSRGQVKVQFGEYGLKSIDAGWLTNRQIEAARIAMTRKIKRGGKVWINVFPDKPFTKKPAETRMGSGKGSPEGWVAVVKPGRVMFELAGVPEPLAREAMRLAGHKLPVKTKFVMREDELMKASELRELSEGELTRARLVRRGASCSACASSTPRASSRTPPACAREARRRARPDGRRVSGESRSSQGLKARTNETEETVAAADETTPEAPPPRPTPRRLRRRTCRVRMPARTKRRDPAAAPRRASQPAAESEPRSLRPRPSPQSPRPPRGAGGRRGARDGRRTLTPKERGASTGCKAAQRRAAPARTPKSAARRATPSGGAGRARGQGAGARTKARASSGRRGDTAARARRRRSEGPPGVVVSDEPTRRSPSGSTWHGVIAATRRSSAPRTRCMRTTSATTPTSATPCIVRETPSALADQALATGRGG